MEDLASQSLKRRRNRPAVSCFPCRKHKLKCDRKTPCDACLRYSRVQHCHQNSSEATHSPVENQNELVLTQSNSVVQQRELQVPASSHSKPNRTLTVRKTPDFETESRLGSENSFSKILPAKPFTLSSTPTSFLSHIYEIPDLTRLRRLKVSEVANRTDTTSKSINDQKDYWRVLLTGMVPKQSFCNVLMDFFFENLNWIYRSIHVPSFMAQYDRFWSSEVREIDLHWLGLLFCMMCCSGIGIGARLCTANGFETKKIRQNAHLWYSASRQALIAGNWESAPSIESLQTIINLQHYFYATKNIETLNVYVRSIVLHCCGLADVTSLLAASIRSAHAMGLNHPSNSSSPLQREIRHRLWWEICQSDTFQAISMQRPTLEQSYLSNVPVSMNCNDEDITESALHVRPIDEPTDMSMNVARGEVFIALNKLYMDGGNRLTSYDFIVEIDTELIKIMGNFPWFFKLEHSDRWLELPPRLDYFPWLLHILHTCICMQRIRMYRPFLHADVGHAAEVTFSAAEDSLSVYKVIRNIRATQSNSPRKYGILYYQVFSVAVTLAVLLLVERPVLSERTAAIRSSIEMVISDLEQLSQEESIPVALEESKIISKILELYDSPERQPKDSANTLVDDIYVIVGGKTTTKKYLERGSSHLTSLPEHQSTTVYPNNADDMDSNMIQSLSQTDWNESLNIDLADMDQFDVRDHIGYGYFDWNWDSVLSMDPFQYTNS